MSSLVSVVTPFFNTAAYLKECIASVLAQTYGDFEYLLVDNCSTDGSSQIASLAAARDSRVRVVTSAVFRSQTENYNFALSHISAASEYCKIVQADDWIFPECLQAMVEVGRRDPRIGIVAAYSLRGTSLRGAGLEIGQWRIEGKVAARMQLLGDVFLTGSPSTVMYRSQIVRARDPFYELDRYHSDTEAAYDIFRHHDLGFVHQVLSYQRVDDESIMGRRRRYAPHLLDRLTCVHRYGKYFLTAGELTATHAIEQRNLIAFLGAALLRGEDATFWKYQTGGYHRMGLHTPWVRIALAALNRVLSIALNPKCSIETLARAMARRCRRLLRRTA